MQNDLRVGPIDLDAAPRNEDYAEGIAHLMREFYRDDQLPTIAFEPGRAMTSSAPSLLLQVLACET